jgi:hypothetical protein
MHLPRKLFQKRFLQSGLAARLTPEQRERLLDSVDADVEALLLDVDSAERDILRDLRSIDSDSDAESADLADLEEDLARTRELKEWCRSKRAEIAGLVS